MLRGTFAKDTQYKSMVATHELKPTMLMYVQCPCGTIWHAYIDQETVTTDIVRLYYLQKYHQCGPSTTVYKNSKIPIMALKK